MQHYEKATKETVFTYKGDSTGEVYLCGKFPDTLESRIPMRRYHNGCGSKEGEGGHLCRNPFGLALQRAGGVHRGWRLGGLF